MTETTSSIYPIRTLDGTTLPAPGTWDIDPGHADLAFTGRHFMTMKVRGRFTDVRGSIVVAEDMNDSTVEVTIGTASVESGSKVRDDHLRSAEMFDVENYPDATFRSVSVVWRGNGGVVHGDLTIHGVTKRVPLEVTFEGYARDPWGGDRAVFSGHTRVNREDFGITWNMALETGGVLVSKDINIDISIESVLRTDG
jgi:polyisoprenoid-binding protein YceI